MVLLGAGVLVVGLASPVSQHASAADRPAGNRSSAVQSWREVPELRTATSDTYRGSGGQLRTELHAAPVNYRAGKSWQKIDSRIVATPVGPHPARDGVVDEYAFHNGANAWQADFKNRLTDGFLRLSVQGQPLTFGLAGASPSAARANGSEITYSQALPGTDLHETVTSTGIKESLTLGSAAAPARYVFHLATPAAAHVTGHALPDGGYEFTSAGGTFVLSSPFAVDAAQVRAAGGKLQPAPDGRHAKLAVSRHGTDWTIALDVDRQWLTARGRSFPVTVDPTISIAANESPYWNFGSGCASCPANSAPIVVGNDGQGAIYRSGVQFDPGGFPANVRVTSATLKLYYDSCNGFSCTQHSHPIDLHRMTTAWTGESTTSEVAFDATPAASTTIPPNPTSSWVSWDLTSLVSSWMAGAVRNYGVLVEGSTESAGPLDEVFFRSTSDDRTDLHPKLEVTWSDDAVVFPSPETLHSNGADLRWGRFDGSTGTTFDRYEIHRSETANFTPSASTLIATIRDQNTVTYRDTTAAPDKAFSYQIVVNGTDASAEQRVTLPAAGRAIALLQPDPVIGLDTDLEGFTSSYGGTCFGDGPNPNLHVGDSNGLRYRGLLRFDTSNITAMSQVTGATLSLYATRLPVAATTVETHEVTSDWQEGSGSEQCDDGASWNYSYDTHFWQHSGGDFDSTVLASKVHAEGDQPGWDAFDITSLAQQWVDGSAPNFGVLLKAADETATDDQVWYDSSDYLAWTAQRPKLAVTYAESTPVNGPQVAISGPVGGASVINTQTITAVASDDGRVTEVDFYVDGVLVGNDSTAPYRYDWATDPVANGSHTLVARATDDAGNVTTSHSVVVSVANSAPPQTSVRVSSNAYAQTVENDGPSAYWRLDETSGTTAVDASGNGRNGSYVPSGHAVSLGGLGLLTGDADHSIGLLTGRTGRTVGQAPSVSAAIGPILAGPMTAEAWVANEEVSVAGYEDRIIARNWGAAGGWLLALQNVAGQQRATFAINNGGTISSASSSVTTGTHYLAGTWDGTTARLYIDGAQTAVTTVGTVTLDTTASVVMGASLDSTIDLDEVALYPQALSAAAIGNHYAYGHLPKATADLPVTASAWDDGEVTKVEFYLDGNRFDEATTAPYTATLDTLDPAAPTYDGVHTLTTKAYDNQGKVTESAPLDVQTINTGGTPYQLDLSSSEAPQAVSWDPSAQTQQSSGVTVHAVNTSGQTLNASDTVLRYRWVTPDPTAQHIDGPDVPLPASLAPGAATDVTLMVQPPALPDGVERAQYDLQIDAYQRSTGSYFAAKGNKPVDNPVVVNRQLSDDLGLERWFHYEGEDIGAGMQHVVNVSNGNSLLTWSPWQEPGRGLATTLDLTYNSLEKKSESPIGNNFSLSISSLSRWGNPIDIHPNNADSIAGKSNKYVDLVDGDGTTHRFTGQQAADGSTYWAEPAGVHLYLRHYSTTDTTKAWALSRPDRVTFFYNDEGYPTSVQDANGNTITFTESAIAPADDPGGPKWHITKVTDAAGRSWNITYYTKNTAKKPQIRGKISQITEHNGDALRFDYYEDGNLLRITQVGGQNADGSPLSDRTFVFSYTTSNGDAPAIPLAADRVNPEPKTSNESTRLYSVRDPRGHETTFEYLGSGNGQDRWKLAARTDRDGTRTSWSYDTTNRVTTQTAPLSRVSKFGYDTTGRLTSITNPNNEKTTFSWTADNTVSQITEPSTRTQKYEYNANGYQTAVIDEANHRTELAYQNVAVDSSDVSGKWATGRTIAHYSQLFTLTSPRGVATAESTTPTDYEWLFSYDAKGNLLTALDPEDRATNGKLTTYHHQQDGTVDMVTDPNGHVTKYENYDANGLPTRVTDAINQQTQLSYDDAGQLQWIQDGNHTSYSGGTTQNYRTYLYYDSFHRQGSMSEPKSSNIRPGVLIWTGVGYDSNDNVISEESPHEGTASGNPGTSTVWTHSYDAMDRVLEDVSPDKSVDLSGERTQYRYDDAGRLVQLTSPKGVTMPGSSQDSAISYDYDSLDRVTTTTRYAVEFTGRVATVTSTLRTFYCYDVAGDLRSVTTPNAHVSSVTCAPYANASNTTKYDYFADHRLQQTTDPDDHVTSQTYDENGNVASSTDELRGRPVLYSHNQRDQVTKIVQPFDDSVTPHRDVTSQFSYDPVGNMQTSTSPRGSDAGNGYYVTSYGYDAINQPILTTLPKDASPTQLYLHQAFDANGNQTMISQPVENSTAPTDEQKTTMQYYDTGWLYSLDKPGLPKSSYDYTAEGWQSSRTATGTDGTTRTASWNYFSDGMLQSMSGQDNQLNNYTYDENNNLKTANLVSGSQDVSTTIGLTANYDSLDRLTSTENHNSTTSNVKISSQSYDDDGNVTQAIQNAAQGPSPDDGETIDYFYTPGDRIDHIYDHGKTSALTDDRRTTYHFLNNGLPQDRTVEADGTSFTTKQTTAWTWFLNGQLKTLVTKNGAGTVRESHAVSYLDSNGNYADDNPVHDTFRLSGPDSTKPCQTSDCTVDYTYDALDRLTDEKRQEGTTQATTHYTLYDSGNIHDSTVNDVPQDSFEYSGDQLDQELDPAGHLVGRYLYDPFGNLHCVTTGTTDASVCKPGDATTPSPQLKMYAKYDALDRMKLSQAYDINGQLDRSASYTYDPLNRAMKEDQSDSSAGNSTTSFNYLGLGNDVSQDQQTTTGGTETRDYSYGGLGERLGLTSQRSATSTPKQLYYGYDAHGNISQLLNDSGGVQASYAYHAYGNPDSALTDERDPDTTQPTNTDPNDPLPPADPVNPYRWDDKRTDRGSGTVDMGARRYSTGNAHFLQMDQFQGALDNLDLEQDTLTQNRYGFAGGNPVSYLDQDGHYPAGLSPEQRRDWTRTAGEEMSSRGASSGGGSSSGGSSSSDTSTRTTTAHATGRSASQSSVSISQLNNIGSCYVSVQCPNVAKFIADQCLQSLFNCTSGGATAGLGKFSDLAHQRSDELIKENGRMRHAGDPETRAKSYEHGPPPKARAYRTASKYTGVFKWTGEVAGLVTTYAAIKGGEDPGLAITEGVTSEAGAASLAWAFGGACVATGFGTVVSPACALVGGGLGAVGGAKLGKPVYHELKDAHDQFYSGLLHALTHPFN
jgi:RHS repeat-associated protein